MLDCSMVRRLFHLETNNKRGHYQVLGTNNTSNNLRLKPVVRLRPKRGIIKVDAGRQGAIFLASLRRNGTQQFVIKVCPSDKRKKVQVSDLEYRIIRKLYTVVPRRVPRPLGFFKCSGFVPEKTWSDQLSQYDYKKQTVACMEYIENGTFGNYLDRMASSPRKRLTDTVMLSFIRQVIQTLIKIQKRYPYFRHGDLHLDNLLVRPTKPIPELVFTDFGWSKLGKTPISSSNYKTTYGIGSNMSPAYDAHLFLMQLRIWVYQNDFAARDGFVRTKKFLDRVVPTGFRNENDKYTRNFRLKYGIRYPLSLRSILNTRVSGVTQSTLKNARTKRQLLLAYGVGPSPANRVSPFATPLAHPNKPTMSLTPRVRK